MLQNVSQNAYNNSTLSVISVGTIQYEIYEQITFNQWVAGSNPARLTTEINDLDENS